MLDGKRYFAAFPDESPEIRQRMQTLGDLLKKLEKELWPHIAQSRLETTHPDGDNEPGFQES